MRLAALALVFAIPAGAAAQGSDLGELRIAIPPALHPSTLVLVERLRVPDVGDADLPAAAIPLHRRWLESRGAVEDAARRSAAAATEAEGGRIRSTLPSLEATRTTDRDALLAALRGSLDSLGRPALLLLGSLQHDAAAEALLAALEANDACRSRGGDCPADPLLSDADAIATWSRITGDDAIAAHALYQRALSLDDGGDAAGAAPLFLAALRIAGIPPELEASAALSLGTITTFESSADVTATYGRCAALAVPGVSDRCSLVGGVQLTWLGDHEAALASLDRALASPTTRDEAATLAGDLVARAGAGGPARLSTSIAAADRALVLDRAAGVLEADGHLSWARDALAAAEALAADPARATRISALEARRSSAAETADAWLARAMRFCLEGEEAVATFTIRFRFAASGPPTVTITPGSGPRPLTRRLSTCLTGTAPPPEPRLRGSWSAHVTLTH